MEKTDTVLKSPNELLQQACEVMGVSNPPQSDKEWAIVVNCWAYNLPRDLVTKEVALLCWIYSVPLADEAIAGILEFQLRKRDREGGNGRGQGR